MIIILILIMLSGMVVYLMTFSMNEESSFHKTQLELLSEKIHYLDSNLKYIRSTNKKLNNE